MSIGLKQLALAGALLAGFTGLCGCSTATEEAAIAQTESTTATTPTAPTNPEATPPSAGPTDPTPSVETSDETVPAGPLDGRIVALDPGHNRGNFTHLDEISEPLFVGLWKTCNTTGTATDDGYLEADYNWDVSRRLKLMLEAAGATVVLTRQDNSGESWGPCIDQRAQFGAQAGADIMISIHADGGPDDGFGHYVIAPGGLEAYTDDIDVDSLILAKSVLAGLDSVGLPRSTYVADALFVSDGYGTLNLADIPTVIVETLNMRNSDDARLAATKDGRSLVAEGLFYGVLDYFDS